MAAARIGDPIKHSNALSGFIVGAVTGLAVGVAVVAATVATGGGALLVISAVGAGVATTGAGASRGGAIGATIQGDVTGKTITGASTVFVNGIQSNRAVIDKVICSKHVNKIKNIAQGSGTVFIESYPAARKGDKIQCGAVISEGSPDVFFGAEAETYLEIDSEIPQWMSSTADWMMTVGGSVALLGFGGAAFIAKGVCGLTRFAGTVALGEVGAAAGSEVGGEIGYRIFGETGREVGKLAGSLLGGLSGGKLGNRTFSGHPVDVVTGALLTERTDFVLPGPIPIEWHRVWLSSSTHQGELGSGWHHPYDMALSELKGAPEAAVGVRLQDGRIVAFPEPWESKPAFNRAEQLVLHRVQDGYRMDDFEGRSYHFLRRLSEHSAPDFMLDAITDLQGNRIALRRNEFGQLLHMKDGTGRCLDILRSSCGRHITSVVLRGAGGEADHPLVSYGYQQTPDGLSDLVSITDAEKATEFFAYTNHLITEEKRRDAFCYWFQWDQTSSPLTARCTKTWGGDNKVPHFYRELAYTPDERRTDVLDGRGTWMTYIGNELGYVHKEIQPNGDKNTYSYDADGLLVSLRTPSGETTYGHDELGRLVLSVAPDQAQTEYRYLVATIHQHIPQPYNQFNTLTTADGADHLFSRDDKGNLVQYIDPEGRHTRYLRDAETGLVQAIQDAHGEWVRYQWNAAQQLASIIHPQGGQERFEYNHLGLLSCHYRDGVETRFNYDGMGRCISSSRSDGQEQHWSYNAEGHLRSHQRADGTRLEWQYLGDLVYRRINPDGSHFNYQYDTDHNLVALVNERGETYRLEYDENERLVGETGFDGRQQRYRYDDKGQLVEWQDQDRLVELTRDPMNRVTQALYRLVDNDGTPLEQTAEHVSFVYDPLGRLLEADNGNRRLAYRYNKAGDLLEEWQDNTCIQHAYSESGLRHSTRLPDGRTLAFEHNEQHQLRELSLDGQILSRHQYDAWGRERQRQCGHLTLLNDYDPLDRLVRQRAGRTTQAPVVARQYRYNQSDQLIEQDDLARGRQRYHYDVRQQLVAWDSQHPQTGHQQGEYLFDPAGQLIGVKEEAQDSTLQQSSSVTTPQGLVQQGRLTHSGDARYLYDARGNRIQRLRGRGGAISTQYRYNLKNELIEVVEQTPHRSIRIRYEYDPLGRRSQKESWQYTTEGGRLQSHVRTDYLWSGDVLLQEDRQTLVAKSERTSAAASAPHERVIYLHEPNSYRPLLQLRNTSTNNNSADQVYYYHLDHLGTPQELTDAEGRVVWQAQYRGFGRAKVVNASIDNPIRFLGQYEDSEVGLHYNRYRYYDPGSGQYTSQDPIGLVGGEQVSQYVSDPVNWVDPLGLQKKKCGDVEETQFEGRGHALNAAKLDLGISRSAHPYSIDSVPMTRKGKKILRPDGLPLMTREYTYLRKDGTKVLIQDHSAGHDFGEGGVGNQGPHFNVRPPENPRTGHVPGTLEHYSW